jgi:hypothetical protein
MMPTNDQIGMTKENLVELVTELIQDIEASAKFAAFKTKRGLETNNGEKVLAGKGWYKAYKC